MKIRNTRIRTTVAAAAIGASALAAAITGIGLGGGTAAAYTDCHQGYCPNPHVIPMANGWYQVIDITGMTTFRPDGTVASHANWGQFQ
ncbi:MAG: hypothetical protein INR66_00320 [Gordonia polyisoprenivorans]|nr:hypothetical protein [Gordonia polyisoprenivorans]